MFKFVAASVVRRYNSFCSDKLNQLKMILSNKYGLECEIELIGSGAKNLVTQNENEPFDLDYNLIINSFSQDFDINSPNNLKQLKDTIRSKLNRILGDTYFKDAQDSTSVLTARLFFTDDPKKKEFSFDIAILTKSKNGNYCRLIHEKSSCDRFFWNEVPRSNDVYEKAEELKECGWWQDVRKTYLKLKNMYLKRNNYNHPSYIVYVEAINQIYAEFENYSE